MRRDVQAAAEIETAGMDLEDGLSAPFAGVVLAGGEGRRWGGPKAWAELPDGRCFLTACVAVLHDAGAEKVVATVPPREIPEGKWNAGLHPLPRPGLDMFSSLAFGLRVLATSPGWDAVVVLPVDFPLVSPETVRALVAAGPPAAIPSIAGRHGHPICLWRNIALDVASGLLPGPTLREVLRAVGARDVAVADPGARANCNTPEMLREALRRMGD